MAFDTVANLRTQGQHVLVLDVATALVYDDSHKLYVREIALAKPENCTVDTAIFWGKNVTIHVKKPKSIRARRIDRRRIDRGGYIQIDEIMLSDPNAVCCGYDSGIFFAELRRLDQGKPGDIWYISRGSQV